MISQEKLQNVVYLKEISTFQNEAETESKRNLKQAISSKTEHNEIDRVKQNEKFKIEVNVRKQKE